MRRALQRTCGISYQAVSQWFTGETSNIKNEHLAAIAQEYNSTLDWLISGKGEMIVRQQKAGTPPPEDHTQAVAEIDALMAAATPRSRSALEHIAAAAASGDLSEDDLVMLEKIAQRLAGSKAVPAANRSHEKLKKRLRDDDTSTKPDSI